MDALWNRVVELVIYKPSSASLDKDPHVTAPSTVPNTLNPFYVRSRSRPPRTWGGRKGDSKAAVVLTVRVSAG